MPFNTRVLTVVPDRRTLIFLCSLIGAMTIASGLLLALEPSPIAPPSGVSLRSVDTMPEDSMQKLFATNPTPHADRWPAIVIHASGATTGSAETIGQVHQRQNRIVLGYHFVVNNGTKQEDGLIEVGFRWRSQLIGAHSSGTDGQWLNRKAVSICLVGNGDEQSYTQTQLRSLLWLVHQLQRRFNISADKVVIRSHSEPGSVGALFPMAKFSRQLLVQIP